MGKTADDLDLKYARLLSGTFVGGETNVAEAALSSSLQHATTCQRDEEYLTQKFNLRTSNRQVEPTQHLQKVKIENDGFSVLSTQCQTTMRQTLNSALHQQHLMSRIGKNTHLAIE